MPPDKVGRATSNTPNRDEVVVISASKFSVLSVDEVEEGEIQKEESLELEEGNNEEDQRQDEREDDFWRMRY